MAQTKVEELITAESEWRYNDSGADLGTAWRGIDYDDSDWSTGKAPLGYGDSGMGTELNFGEDSTDKFITQYFRKEFTVSNPDHFSALILRVQRDDGIAVYINDQLMLRDNLSPAAAFDTLAEWSIDTVRENVWVDSSLATTSLVAGRNVIAVEVHQSTPASSDSRFDCQLLLSTSAAEYGEVRVGIQTRFDEGGPGKDSFSRYLLANPPEIEMNWMSQSSGDRVGHTFSIVDANGSADTQFLIWDETLSKWESERIDTRNYSDVRVRVNLRTNDESNGFEASDYFRAEIDISTTGLNFETLQWFELKGGGSNGDPGSLDTINFGAENRKTTFESPAGLIPDGTASIRIRFEAKVNDERGEIIYFDDVGTSGDPIVADSYMGYMQFETGWDIEDPRIDYHADPDGDSIPNLLEYAFGSHPQIASLTTVVKGEKVPILPVWKIDPARFATVSYRQISAPLAADGDDFSREGFHVQDIRYRAQISRGDLDANGEMIWSDGAFGGDVVFEQRDAFEENDDGTVQVKLRGLRDLSAEKAAYMRLVVHFTGFDVPMD
ncbi:MAG: hypothetical protein R3F19_10040 [Verrucomicrobiales bacterium]